MSEGREWRFRGTRLVGAPAGAGGRSQAQKPRRGGAIGWGGWIRVLLLAALLAIAGAEPPKRKGWAREGLKPHRFELGGNAHKTLYDECISNPNWSTEQKHRPMLTRDGNPSSPYLVEAGEALMKVVESGQLEPLPDHKPWVFPENPRKEHVGLLMGIFSSCTNYHYREQVRATWFKWGPMDRKGKERSGLNGWKGVFVLSHECAEPAFWRDKAKTGTSGVEEVARIAREMAEHGDILLQPTEESYFALSSKALNLFDWAHTREDADFVVKTDDDAYLYPGRIMFALERAVGDAGCVYMGHKIDLNIQDLNVQDPTHKWWIPPYDIARYKIKTGMIYMQGGCYVLSRDLVTRVASRDIQPSKYMPEDLMVGHTMGEDSVRRCMCASDLFVDKTDMGDRRVVCHPRGLAMLHSLHGLKAHDITAFHQIVLRAEQALQESRLPDEVDGSEFPFCRFEETKTGQRAGLIEELMPLLLSINHTVHSSSSRYRLGFRHREREKPWSPFVNEWFQPPTPDELSTPPTLYIPQVGCEDISRRIRLRTRLRPFRQFKDRFFHPATVKPREPKYRHKMSTKMSTDVVLAFRPKPAKMDKLSTLVRHRNAFRGQLFFEIPVNFALNDFEQFARFYGGCSSEASSKPTHEIGPWMALEDGLASWGDMTQQVLPWCWRLSFGIQVMQILQLMKELKSHHCSFGAHTVGINQHGDVRQVVTSGMKVLRSKALMNADRECFVHEQCRSCHKQHAFLLGERHKCDLKENRCYGYGEDAMAMVAVETMLQPMLLTHLTDPPKKPDNSAAVDWGVTGVMGRPYGDPFKEELSRLLGIVYEEEVRGNVVSPALIPASVDDLEPPKGGWVTDRILHGLEGLANKYERTMKNCMSAGRKKMSAGVKEALAGRAFTRFKSSNVGPSPEDDAGGGKDKFSD